MTVRRASGAAFGVGSPRFLAIWLGKVQEFHFIIIWILWILRRLPADWLDIRLTKASPQLNQSFDENLNHLLISIRYYVENLRNKNEYNTCLNLFLILQMLNSDCYLTDKSNYLYRLCSIQFGNAFEYLLCFFSSLLVP